MNKVTVIGMGMMGASFALALKRAGLGQTVTGIDIQPAVLDAAVQRGIIDNATIHIDSGIREADIVVLATPVSAVVKLLSVLADLEFAGLIIDLGSTKQTICEAARNLPGLKFIGCHPMAGSEMAGLGGAKADLFDNAPVIITPPPGADEKLVDRVIGVWRRLGCRVTLMDPGEHDFSVAIISHLPYLTAVATMHAAAELAREKPDIFTLIAGGFRDTTRVSEGDPVMWRDICLTNHVHILRAIAQLRRTLDEMEQALAARDGNRLQAIFQSAQNRRKTYIPKKK